MLLRREKGRKHTLWQPKSLIRIQSKPKLDTKTDLSIPKETLEKEEEDYNFIYRRILKKSKQLFYTFKRKMQNLYIAIFPFLDEFFFIALSL